MTPFDLAVGDIHDQQLTQVSLRCRMLGVDASHRTCAATPRNPIDRPERRALAVERDGDVQESRLRAVGHRAPALESRCAGAHFNLNTDLGDHSRAVSDFAGFGIYGEDVLITDISRVDEFSGGTIQLP